IMETNALFVLSGTVQSLFPIPLLLFKSRLNEEYLYVIAVKKLLARKLGAYYNREENLIKSKIFDVE
ncbi:15310_t:CDS:2, partial [Cetraspora pellucida]